MTKKMNNKTFLLCLGTQKAGTSWLWDFLKDQKNINFGYRKEYHVFDRLQFQKFMQKDVKDLKYVAESGNITAHKDLFKRLSMISNTNEYFDYFSNLLHSGAADITGDFTPLYSLLDTQTLNFIKDEFHKRGIETKVIFLMRDPVERIWSATRMSMRELKLKNIPLVGAHKEKFVEMLTRYEVIVPKINSVFNQDSVYYNFYEKLFTDGTMKEILEFLNLPMAQANFSKRVNQSKYAKIAQRDREIVEQYYADTYSFVKDEFKENYAWRY